jgi:rubrerythrin
LLQFNDLTGLQIAIHIETQGQEFYRQAYEHAANPDHKELFLLLMNDEIHHRQAFQTILSEVKTFPQIIATDSYFDKATAEHLNALANSHIFPVGTEAAQVVDDFKNIETILKTAMQAEKDSVEFYSQLAKHAKFPEVQTICAKFVKEEETHVAKLKEYIDAYA